ncbi:MAG: phage holin [Anaerolineaceae bacterium]|jgi:LL-H family phage holin
MNQYVQPLISALILCVIGSLSYFLKQAADMSIAYMKTKMSATNVQLFRDMASTVVRSMEQNSAFKDLAGSLKKERAIVAMTDYAVKIGLPVDTAFVDKMIEEAVQIMNTDLGPDFNWMAEEAVPVTPAAEPVK